MHLENTTSSRQDQHKILSLCSAMIRPSKPMIRVCGIVGRNGCIALHYHVHFLRIFSFVTRGIESEGIGARSVRCLTPFV